MKDEIDTDNDNEMKARLIPTVEVMARYFQNALTIGENETPRKERSRLS